MNSFIRVHLCSSAAVLFLALPALAAVDGTVTNKTTGQPQSGATVTLYKLGQAGMESVESVKSGAAGKFHIDQTPQGPHLIQTAFDGVTYNHMLPPGSDTSSVSLEVYNSSKQPGAARIARHFVIFQPSGAQMSVNEGFIFRNDGQTTYNDPDGGTLKFFLPVAAKGIAQVKATAPQGMPIDRAADKTSQPNIYKVDFPIKPGETEMQVTYLLPYNNGAAYEGKVLFKTEEPTLLVVPDGITLTGEGLESKGQEPRSKASVFSVKTAEYKVQIAGAAPVASSDSDSDSGPSLEEVAPKVLQQNMKWILALALAILALGFVLLYRAQPGAGRAAAGAVPSSAPPAPPVTSAKGKNDRGRR